MQIKPIRLLKISESLIVYVLNYTGGHIIQKWYEYSILMIEITIAMIELFAKIDNFNRCI